MFKSSELAFSFTVPVCKLQTTESAVSPSRRQLFVFGLGYVGLPYAEAMERHGWSVAGITRTSKSAQIAAASGIPALPVDAANAIEIHDFVSHHLATASHVLSTIAPPSSPTPPADQVLQHYLPELRSAKHLSWIGYISSTSVYGDHGGRPVNENTLPSNPSRKGQLRLAAEDEWRAFANSTASSLCIFRLSGIYGPGRSALHTFHRNPSVLSDTRDTLDMIVSRVHLDDIVAALVAAVAADRKTMQKADHLLAQDMTVNISDDLPATRRDVFNYASKLLSRNARAALDDDNVERRVSGRNLYRASKRVSNHKMKQILLPQLRYPTYKEGFAALIREVL